MNESGQTGLPGVPTRVLPVASSTPRPGERWVSGAGLLTSVPDPVAPVNHDGTSLRMHAVDRHPRWTRLRRRLPGPASGGPNAPAVWLPLKTIARAVERGLTAQPSPQYVYRIRS